MDYRTPMGYKVKGPASTGSESACGGIATRGFFLLKKGISRRPLSNGGDRAIIEVNSLAPAVAPRAWREEKETR